MVEDVLAGLPQRPAVGLVVGPEVDRVDVLVLLGRVLGVADAAVGQLGEPARDARPPRGGRASTGGRSRARSPGRPWPPRPPVSRSRPRCPARDGWRCGRPRRRRSPTGCPRRRAGRAGCCCGPCGGCGRSGGSAAGRARRSRGRRCGAAGRPRPGSRRRSGGTARTRRCARPGPGRPRTVTTSIRCGPSPAPPGRRRPRRRRRARPRGAPRCCRLVRRRPSAAAVSRSAAAGSVGPLGQVLAEAGPHLELDGQVLARGHPLDHVPAPGGVAVGPGHAPRARAAPTSAGHERAAPGSLTERRSGARPDCARRAPPADRAAQLVVAVLDQRSGHHGEASPTVALAGHGAPRWAPVEARGRSTSMRSGLSTPSGWPIRRRPKPHGADPPAAPEPSDRAQPGAEASPACGTGP